MKPYQKTYMDFFGYEFANDIISEISEKLANEIHHIEARKMGGSKTKDNIENLIAVTREEHEEYGDKKQHMIFLKETHKKFMEKHGVKRKTH